MASVVILLLSILLGLTSDVVKLFKYPRMSRRFWLETLGAIGLYLAHGAMGLAGLIHGLMPLGPQSAGGALVAFLGWLGWGFLGLLRRLPRLQEPPRSPAILSQFGLADAACLLLIVGGVISATR
jgi:hypothetical protein